MQEQLIDLQKQYLIPTYAPGLFIERGRGSYVYTPENEEYLDFSSGIAVCNLGHCHPHITQAIATQAAKLIHVSNLYYNQNQPRLAQKLAEKSFDGKTFFCNSGAEANEGMIKLARKWGTRTNRHEIIAMEDSFHGRTLATLAATGREKYRKGFQPDMQGFKHVPFNDIQALRASISSQTVAIMLEPVQGEGGVVPAHKAYLEEVRQLCDNHDLLLLFDEVQCGMGRTGTMFAWQHYGVQPDMMSLAKALGNGFPIGAFMATGKCAGVLEIGTHASTFGGNPLACAAALAVMDVFDDEGILDNCQAGAKQLRKGLERLQKRFSEIEEVRGLGLMLGIQLSSPVAEIMKACRDRGLLVLSAGENVLRLLPPLTVNTLEIENALGIIEQVLTETNT